MWKLLLVCCLVVLGQVQCSPIVMEFPGEREGDPLQGEESNDYESATGNANQYLDELLKNARGTFRDLNLDPVDLPDINEGFDKKVGLIRFHGGFKATNGKLSGLSTIHRAGDATLEMQGDTIAIRATLAVENMNVGTNARVWFGKLNIPWHMASTVKYLKATIGLKIPVDANGDVKPRATELTIHEIGKINVTFKNLGPLNWILNGMGFAITNMFKNVLKNKISSPILNAINKALDKMPDLAR